MPTLPTADDLSRPDSGRSGRSIASAPVDHISGALQGMSRALSEVAAVGAEIRQRDDEAAVTRAMADFGIARIQNADAFETGQAGQDYGAWGERAGSDLKKVRDRLAESIRDPRRRESFLTRTDLSIVEHQSQVASQGYTLARGARREHLNSAIAAQATVISAAHSRGDVINIDRATAEAVLSIKHAVETGDLLPGEGEKLIREFRQSAAEGRVVADIAIDPAAAIDGLGGGYSSLVSQIEQAESGGDAAAKNPNSSATGSGQFTNSTWLEMIRTYRPDLAEGKTDAEILALRTDRELSRQMIGRYAEQNSAHLAKAGHAATPGNVYLAHFLGPAGAVAALNADPSAKLSDVLPAVTFEANSFLDGWTVAKLTAWSASKMKGASAPPSYYSDLSAGDHARLLGQARTGMQGEIAKQGSARVAAVLNFGPDSPSVPSMPSREVFIDAYGPSDGPEKFDQLTREVEVAAKRFAFKSQSSDEIAAAVEALKPVAGVTPPDQVAAQAQAYQTAATAAAAEIKARNDDPFGYVAANNPEVGRQWDEVQAGRGNLSAAIAVSAQAQGDLGIPARSIAPLPASVAESSLENLEAASLSASQRLGPIVNLLAAAEDPGARAAIVEQLIANGMKEEMVSVLDAALRQDQPAAERLLAAASIDLASLPPNPGGTKDSAISDALTEAFLADGSFGDAVYGVGSGRQDMLRNMAADAALAAKAVKVELLRNGGDLSGAVASVMADLHGDIEPVRTSGVVIALPAGEDENAVVSGLNASLSEVEAAMLAWVPPVDESLIGQAGADARTQRRLLERNVTESMALGEWRNISPDAFGFFVNGVPVTRVDGGVVSVTIDAAKEAGAVNPTADVLMEGLATGGDVDAANTLAARDILRRATLQAAREQLADGVDRETVERLLRSRGIDPSELESPR